MYEIKILYVDDEAINTLNFKILFNKNYNVYIAKDGAAALSILKEEKVDILFTDQKMPNMLGTELCKEIIDMNLEIPCYLITGYLNDDKIAAAYAEKTVKGIITKPFLKNQIEDIINIEIEKKP